MFSLQSRVFERCVVAGNRGIFVGIRSFVKCPMKGRMYAFLGLPDVCEDERRHVKAFQILLY